MAPPPAGTPERIARLAWECERALHGTEVEPPFRSLAGAHQYRQLYALTERYVAPDARVLDWGCGRGHFAWLLHLRGNPTAGYTLEPPPRWPAGHGPCVVRGTDADPVTLPFADASFDAVFSVGVLEHVRELGGTEAASLAEIARVLAPGGVFIAVHLPNRWSWIEALARLRARRRGAGQDERLWRGFHSVRYEASELRALCEGAGLEVLEQGRYGMLPRNVLGRLPERWRRSRAVARGLDAVEEAVLGVAASCAQHWHVVAKRRVFLPSQPTA